MCQVLPQQNLPDICGDDIYVSTKGIWDIRGPCKGSRKHRVDLKYKSQFHNLCRYIEASQSVISPLGLAEIKDIYSIQMGILCIVKIFQTSFCSPPPQKKKT